jgi:hypothetical protein
MLILERLSLFTLPWLRRASGCHCRQVLILHDNWLTRFFIPRKWYLKIEGRHRGKGAVLASFKSAVLTETLVEGNGIDKFAERGLIGFFRDRMIANAFRKFLAEWIEGSVALYEAGLSQAISCKCDRVLFIASCSESFRIIQRWKEIQEQQLKPDRIEVVLVKVASVMSTVGSWLYSLAVVVAFIGTVIGHVLRQGIMLRAPVREHFRILMHDYWDVSQSRPWDIRAADFLVDKETIHHKDVFVLLSRQPLEKNRLKQYSGSGLACRAINEVPFCLPSLMSICLRLVRAITWLMVPSQAVGIMRRRSVGAMLYGVMLENVMWHYSFGALLSCEEHSHVHIVETAVLNRFGTKTVWIPHSVALKPGYSSSYLSYDLCPCPGSSVADLDNGTWNRRMRVKIIGLPANDALLSDRRSMLAREEVRHQVESVRGEHKVVAAFTGSYTPDDFVDDRYLAFLRILKKLAEAETTVKIILKPKANEEWPEHGDFLLRPPFESVIGRLVRDGRMVILNPRYGLACSAQYLINQSVLSLSTAQYALFGSVWAEALLLGKPSLAFAPPEFRQAPSAGILCDRWVFDDEERMVEEALRALRSQREEERDPYRDGHALNRLRAEIITMLNPDAQPETA